MDTNINNISITLLQDKECLFCFEIKEDKEKICNKCDYEICIECYDLYINKYKYNSCPHCKNILIPVIKSSTNYFFKDICLFIFRTIIFIISIILFLILFYSITGNKQHRTFVGDIFLFSLFIIIIIGLSNMFCSN